MDPTQTATIKPARKHTLEKLVDAMGKGFDEDKLHSALLLAYTSAVYGVSSKDVVPSSLYTMDYNESNNNLVIEETKGLSLPLENGMLEINLMDFMFSADIRSIPVLLEGETGVGKTFNAMKYLATSIDSKNFFSYRLSASAFLNNLFTHFQEGEISKGGMPVVTAKTDRIENCAAGILDEINRGDSNETLQMLDNEMHLGGHIYKLGIHIPDIKGGVFKLQSGRKKKLSIVCAQNPAGTEDAKFTQTLQLDAAVDNRLLKTYVGNASASAGSTLWLCDAVKNPHEEFIKSFKKIASNMLGVDQGTFSEIDEDWLSTYAWITDSARTDKATVYSAIELSDIMIALFSGDPIEYYNYERQVLDKWDKKLKKGVVIKNDLKETKDLTALAETTKTFKVPMIFRDTVQLKKNADVLATLKNIKDALVDKNPLKHYLAADRYVTVREVAEATVLVARNKQASSAKSPIDQVNHILNQYLQLVKSYMHDTKSLGSGFDLHDNSIGLKSIGIYKAFRETVKNSQNADYLIDKLSENAKIITGYLSVSEPVRNLIAIKSAGDLMTLCGFIHQFKPEVNKLLSSYKPNKDIMEVNSDIAKLYMEKLENNAMVLPSIYQHRIRRTLGE